MSDLITIHDKNGIDAITTTPEHAIHQLIAYGALDRIIELIKLLRVMSTAKRLGDDAAHKAAAGKYGAVFGAAIDNLKMGEVVTAQTANAPLSNSRPVAPQRSNTKPCKECGTPIVFLTSDGKWIAVESSSVKDNEKEYNSATHKRHFSTKCKPNKFTPPDAKTRKEQAELF